jgi:hypothetical protein
VGIETVLLRDRAINLEFGRSRILIVDAG